MQPVNLVITLLLAACAQAGTYTPLSTRASRLCRRLPRLPLGLDVDQRIAPTPAPGVLHTDGPVGGGAPPNRVRNVNSGPFGGGAPPRVLHTDGPFGGGATPRAI